MSLLERAATAARKRRLMRLRTTAFPVFLVTVYPMRGSPSASRFRPCNTKARRFTRPPFATARNSERFLSVFMSGVGCVARAVITISAACSSPIRRLGACDPWPDGEQGPDGRFSLPCVSGNRDGACGQDGSADTYASLFLTRAASAALILKILGGSIRSASRARLHIQGLGSNTDPSRGRLYEGVGLKSTWIRPFLASLYRSRDGDMTALTGQLSVRGASFCSQSAKPE